MVQPQGPRALRPSHLLRTQWVLTGISLATQFQQLFFSEDTPFGQVKLGELPAWLSRRSKNPVDWGRAVSRAYWRWQHAHVMPRNAGITWVIQGVVGLSVTFYILNSDKIRKKLLY